MSSACLILILILSELMLDSIRTFSFSFLDTITGASSTSFETLDQIGLPSFNLWFVVSFNHL
jgi:hypothetical protein